MSLAKREAMHRTETMPDDSSIQKQGTQRVALPVSHWEMHLGSTESLRALNFVSLADEH
jgi:hypothetical protein